VSAFTDRECSGRHLDGHAAEQHRREVGARPDVVVAEGGLEHGRCGRRADVVVAERGLEHGRCGTKPAWEMGRCGSGGTRS